MNMKPFSHSCFDAHVKAINKVATITTNENLNKCRSAVRQVYEETGLCSPNDKVELGEETKEELTCT